MTLIAILITLVLERTAESLRDLRQHRWFDRYMTRLRGWGRGALWDGPIGLLLVLLPLLVIVALVVAALDEVLLGIPLLIVSVAILFLCMGPRDLDEQVDAFLEAWHAGDDEEALKVARQLVMSEVPSDPARLQHVLAETILVQANERVMAVLFWFVLLGPLGAVLYRFSGHAKNAARDEDSGFAAAARRLHALLAWAPAYLCALGFALAGSFVDAWHSWRRHAPAWDDDWQAAVDGVLTSAGLGALQLDVEPPLDDSGGDAYEGAEVPPPPDHEAIYEHIRTVLGLVWRTIVIWVAVIALSTVMGLLG